MSEPQTNDDAILANMLREAESLCRSDDALLRGQYVALPSLPSRCGRDRT